MESSTQSSVGSLLLQTDKAEGQMIKYVDVDLADTSTEKLLSSSAHELSKRHHTATKSLGASTQKLDRGNYRSCLLLTNFH